MKPPSSKNRQPWKYIVVQGDAKEEMLRGFRQGIEREENECALLPQSKRYIAAAKHTVDLMEAAPTIVLVVNSIGKNEMGEMTPEEHVYEICNIQSIGASIQNMLLAATEKGIGSLWICDAYYEDGCFYIITYAASNKMKQIDHNPIVAVAGEWFTAHGKGINLGWFCKKENHEMAQKLRQAFSEWIDNGHNNFDDENTIILCIQLTEGTLFSHGTRYDIDFSDN
ncbi:nitroreductase family protein [Extibacter muris]|uniref:Nitroreductase family protein n=1 Tax=Extibacter muris TaxID=1796622 RepID=A0A4R4FJ54_9FIRM|nr:nitroreductase family protein [Extibacter muris]TDA22836.1 nitroreductase family protein [Extibacter muris]